MSFKKVLLVKPSGRHGLSYAFDLIPTGLEYIASNIEDVVDEVTILDLEMVGRPFEEAINESMRLLRPDLVGISMSATDHREGLDIARLAKEHGAMTVLGGYHPTAIPDNMLLKPQIDFVVRGEGELTMRELVVKGKPKGVLGTSYKEGEVTVHNPDRPPIEDLDSLLFPARHLRKYTYRTRSMRGREFDVLTTSRGCWGRCTFCCEPSMSKSHQRYRTPENVMKEILEIVAFHHDRPLSIDITDPHFMGSPKRVDRLCDLMSQHDLDIRFGAKVRADSVANNPETVRKMISVGIIGFEMGIESPNVKDIESIGKGLRPDTYAQAVENIKLWGGNAGGTFVIGLPGQTEEQILEFPSYAKRIGLTSTAYGIATPFPSTKFYDELNSKGLIFEKNWNLYDEMHSVFRSDHISSERLEELASICMARFWTVDTFIEKERMRVVRTSSKRRLAEFVQEKFDELCISLDMGSQLRRSDLGKHVEYVIETSADPNIATYTKEVGVHNVIEMGEFLRILGDQEIQLTIRSNGQAITSWVVKTSQGKVDQIQVFSGKKDSSTINVDMDLEEFGFGKGRDLTALDGIRIAGKMIASNRGIEKQPNMARLMAAVLAELLIGQLGSVGRKRRSINS